MIRRPIAHLALLVLAAPAAAQVSYVFPGVHLPLMQSAYQVADVDLDGLPDLVGEGFGSGPVLHVARGLAAGGFAPVQTWPLVGSSKLCLAVGDLNGDAWPDVALGDYKERVVVAPGTGEGTFSTSAMYYVGNGKPFHVAIADVNHDGIGDLLTGTDSSPGWLNVTLADGTGGYLGAHAYTPGTKISDMEIADLDGDGWTDAVCCDSSANKLAVLLGDGAGGFLPAQVQITADNPREVHIAPLDGDADLDVLLIAPGNEIELPGVVHVWLGDGTGALASGPAVGVEAYPGVGTLHDMDADGDLDAVVISAGTHAASILRNDGSAHFALLDKVALGEGSGTVAALDATADGVPDLLTHSVQQFAALFPGQPGGIFPDQAVWLGADGQTNRIAAGRVTGDDIPDVVFISVGGYKLATLQGTATGFSTTAIVSPGFLSSADVCVGDIDGDDLADAVTSVANPARLQVGRSLGNGVFGGAEYTPLTVSPTPPSLLTLADLDGDGWRDVVGLVTGSSSDVVTLLNTGSAHPGQFMSPAIHWAGKFSHEIEVGDIDGDGDPDVVTLDYMTLSVKDGSLRTLLGDGAGALQPGPISLLDTPQYEAQGLALADFDLDGALDAAVGEYYGYVAIAHGDGAGSFAVTGWDLDDDWDPQVLVAGDLDGDGWPDLVSGGGNSISALVLHRGDGAGGLLPLEAYAVPDGVQDIVLADFTLDGRPDLVTASYAAAWTYDGQIQLYPNIADPFVWTNLGSGLAGAAGEPRLTGTGALVSGTPGFVRLTFAAPLSLCALSVAADANPTPFKGGVLVPVPPAVLGFLATDALGVVTVPWASWPSSQPGADWFFQFGVLDAGAPHGVALSNAVAGTEPD